MTRFVIKDWDKSEHVFELVGWRRDHQAVLLLDKDQRQVMQPILSCPPGGHLRGNSFPDSVPTEIRPARLLPPPCVSTEAEAMAMSSDPAVASFVPWKTEYGEVLWPKADDNGPLREFLKQYQDFKRCEYEERTRECDSIADPVERARQAEILERVYTQPLHRPWKDDDVVVGGCLNWTLEVVKSGGPLLEQYLHQRWARENGFDLDEMELDRLEFIAWLNRNFVNAVFNVADSRFGTRYQQEGYHLAHNAEQALCAQVRYTLNFSDGTHLWMKCYELRPPLDASEHEEFDVCLRNHADGRVEKSHPEHNNQVLSKLDSMDQKLESVDKNTTEALTGVNTLKELAGEQATTRGMWFENPLGSREAVANYLLTMDAMKIGRNVAVAIVRFAYGDTRKGKVLDPDWLAMLEETKWTLRTKP